MNSKSGLKEIINGEFQQLTTGTEANERISTRTHSKYTCSKLNRLPSVV